MNNMDTIAKTWKEYDSVNLICLTQEVIYIVFILLEWEFIHFWKLVIVILFYFMALMTAFVPVHDMLVFIAYEQRHTYFTIQWG